MSQFLENVMAVLAVIAVVGFFVYCLALVVVGARAERACLRLGWPGHSLDFGLNAYCIARTDQTDIVVPLAEAKKR